jgi:4-hydroxy-3-polyprenylbenzoate decarboxylase
MRDAEASAEAHATHPASPIPHPGAPSPASASQALSHPESSRALMAKLPVILAITGASGAPYGVRLLEMLAVHQVPTWLLVSSHGWRLLAEECGIKDDRELKKATGGEWTSVRVFDDSDRGAEPASGSARTAGMVICPCSMGTVAAIAHGTSRSLIERAADVILKERRTLILVPRETPLSLVHLRNLTLATEAGAVVLPAAPGFYHKPQQVRDLVDFVVQRVLDHLDLEINLVKRWEGNR